MHGPVGVDVRMLRRLEPVACQEGDLGGLRAPVASAQARLRGGQSSTRLSGTGWRSGSAAGHARRRTAGEGRASGRRARPASARIGSRTRANSSATNTLECQLNTRGTEARRKGRTSRKDGLAKDRQRNDPLFEVVRLQDAAACVARAAGPPCQRRCHDESEKAWQRGRAPHDAPAGGPLVCSSVSSCDARASASWQRERLKRGMRTFCRRLAAMREAMTWPGNGRGWRAKARANAARRAGHSCDREGRMDRAKLSTRLSSPAEEAAGGRASQGPGCTASALGGLE